MCRMRSALVRRSSVMATQGARHAGTGINTDRLTSGIVSHVSGVLSEDPAALIAGWLFCCPQNFIGRRDSLSTDDGQVSMMDPTLERWARVRLPPTPRGARLSPMRWAPTYLAGRQQVTTILAIETLAGVQIGCDSQATGPADKIQMEQPKVFTNNGAIYGIAGMALLANEMRYGDLPEPPQDMDETDRWMTREVIPAIRAIIEEIAPKRGEDDYEMHLLVVANGRAYEVGSNAGWIRNTAGVYAIGSGGPFAAGAISAGASMQQALEIAAKHDPYTGYQLTATTDRALLAQ